jgi:hypothetical protein
MHPTIARLHPPLRRTIPIRQALPPQAVVVLTTTRQQADTRKSTHRGGDLKPGDTAGGIPSVMGTTRDNLFFFHLFSCVMKRMQGAEIFSFLFLPRFFACERNEGQEGAF